MRSKDVLAKFVGDDNYGLWLRTALSKKERESRFQEFLAGREATAELAEEFIKSIERKTLPWEDKDHAK